MEWKVHIRCENRILQLFIFLRLSFGTLFLVCLFFYVFNSNCEMIISNDYYILHILRLLKNIITNNNSNKNEDIENENDDDDRHNGTLRWAHMWAFFFSKLYICFCFNFYFQLLSISTRFVSLLLNSLFNEIIGQNGTHTHNNTGRLWIKKNKRRRYYDAFKLSLKWLPQKTLGQFNQIN